MRSPASRLLQAWISRALSTMTQSLDTTQSLCRSALARECSVSATGYSADPPRSPASRLLRIWARCTLSKRRRAFVGARLPANAECQPLAIPLTHRVRQQAGSYGSRPDALSQKRRRTFVGARLPAKAVCQPLAIPLTHRIRGQARSYSRPSFKRVTTAIFIQVRSCSDPHLSRFPSSNADEGDQLFVLSVSGKSFGQRGWQFKCLSKAKPPIKPAKFGLTE